MCGYLAHPLVLFLSPHASGQKKMYQKKKAPLVKSLREQGLARRCVSSEYNLTLPQVVRAVIKLRNFVQGRGLIFILCKSKRLATF